MKWYKILGVSTLSAVLLFGCSNTEDKKEENKNTEQKEEVVVETKFDEAKEKEAILAVIHENEKYAESEDIDAYMDTLNISEENFEQSKASNQEVFDMFDIDYEITDPEFVSVEEDKAVVNVKQKSVATYVPEDMSFNNTIVTVEHTLVKVEGKWKIQSSEPDRDTIEVIN